ncbi:MAG: PAS domain S-box protein [Actinobacteria bacterium]|nr:PAS domain S-box protein [Actinomycetota bacterium]MSZ05223.1 PAS domain S-box protein [Actinomycetota bacterium]
MPMRPAEQQWLLLEAAADATLVVGRDGLINRANRRTAEILGWQPAELIGQSVEVLVPPASRTAHSSFRKAFVASPRPRMMGAGLELTAIHRDGHEVPVEISLNPLVTEEGEFVVVAVRDISYRLHIVSQLNETAAKLAVVDERDRIARDLHDNIIQRLFAAGLHLQASLGRPDQDPQLVGVIDEIDEAITQIRTIIFTMHSLRGMDAGFEPAVRLVLAESSRVLGHHPSLIQHGVLALVPDSLASEATDVIRELLTNVAKHARATHSSVNISVEDNWLTVTVSDNGVGPDRETTPAGLGLGNLSQRANGYGGRFSFDAGEAGGSMAVWAVPLA